MVKVTRATTDPRVMQRQTIVAHTQNILAKISCIGLSFCG
jgi:hypothetical protein